MNFKRKTSCYLRFFLILFLVSSCNSKKETNSQNFEKLTADFITPADDNTVWCYWYWINDDISKNGITKDLLAMKKAGIGGALIGNINPARKDGKVPMLSEEWWSHMAHAVVEGKRIGVDIGVFNCPGWSQSGGPWVDAEKAMRYLTYSETKVLGGKAVSIKLAQPEKEFQDTHTFAFKTSNIEKKNTQHILTKITTNWQDVNLPKNAPILWIHRTMPEMDIYFITNQSDKQLDLSPVFRVDKTMQPQLWNAISGEMRALPDYEVTATGIKVPLKMQAAQSWFVVFTDKDNNTEVKPAYTKNFPEYKKLKTIKAPFKVDFLNKEIAPKAPVVFNTLTDWRESDNEQIKYYSGSAVYKTSFNIDKLPENEDVCINLGKLFVMAKVKLNGKYIGGVWVAPYRLNISDVLKKGENELEVEVVNLWRNQLIKDKQRPKDEKYTWLVTDEITEKSTIQSSGLLGPVVIETIK